MDFQFLPIMCCITFHYLSIGSHLLFTKQLLISIDIHIFISFSALLTHIHDSQTEESDEEPNEEDEDLEFADGI